jgi:putative CocE/NonD family hydrolase
MRSTIVLVAFALLSVFVITSCREPALDLDRPFGYADTQEPEYESLTVTSEHAPMSDGTKLAVDVYLPSNGKGGSGERESFPVVLRYTPYGRSTIDPETGKVNDYRDAESVRYFTSFGYALVVADMRGTGASSGWLLDCMPQLASDGKELVDWIAAQPWCDGNVGMSGGSYLGWSQFATASQRPAALKCIAPAVIYLDVYSMAFPGGIYVQGFIEGWTDLVQKLRQNLYLPDEGILPSKPVVDEDLDGEISDEIPMDTDGDGSFLDERFPPPYADGQPRTGHVYYNATIEHQKNFDPVDTAARIMFRDEPVPLDYTGYDLSIASRLPDLIEADVPIYHFGGWFDGCIRGTWQLYSTIGQHRPQKIVVFPGYHNIVAGPYLEHLGIDPETLTDQFTREHRRYYDRYLKGIENGIDNEPPIAIYVMNGGGWRFENEWPLARQVETPYYLDDGHLLSLARQRDGADTHRADFTHSSAYGENGGNRWLSLYGLTPNALPIRTEKDRQCLVYTSGELSQDMEVTGHPIVNLWVSSTEDYGDIFVYIEDVDPAGRAVLVTEAQHRAGFAELYDNNTIMTAANEVDIKPELPWHGYDESQFVDRSLADGRVVELLFDFEPTSWVFKKGHAVRVSIAAANWPTFRLHERLSPANDPNATENRVPTITIHRDADHPSRVILPVIPKAY